ncbi:hypothetical protein NDA16_000961 [Ustilago loliicola]|nr:hypothetical protein NDA16_000961 [Ustilago loliicola]
MPIDLKKALKTDDPKWDKFKQGYKKVETGAWNALAPVGNWTNRTAGKFGAESFWPTELGLECDKAARILRTFTMKGASVEVDANNAADLSDQNAVIPPSAPKVDANAKKSKDPHKYDSRKTQKVIRKIPPSVLQKAQGLAIFTVFRGGFGCSGASGSGVVLSRLPDGSWSAPSGILIHTIGYGLLIGLDIYDVVLVLRNQKAVDAFKHPKFSLGGELSVACGPVGNGRMLDSGVEAAPCWSYLKSKGLYLGIQLDGNIVLKRDDENGRFYKSPGIKVEQILSGQITVPAPAAVLPLWQTIYAAEGRPNVMGIDRTPEGATPGDLELTEEDMKDANRYAEQEKQQQLYGAAAAPVVGSTHSQSIVPPSGGSSHATAPASTSVVGANAAPATQPYSDLPPDYEFANSPVNAQDGHAGAAASYASAEQEKARLEQLYNTPSNVGAASGAGVGVGATVGSAQSIPSRAQAMYDFNGQEQGDLSFKTGDIIQVTGEEDEMWWRGTLDGRTGIFPRSYVRAL